MNAEDEQLKPTPSLDDAPVPVPIPAPQLPVERRFTAPLPGTSIISPLTGNNYRIFQELGQGNFGIVFACTDTWNNDLAAKVFKPRNLPYEVVQGAAAAEFVKLMQLRHPNITHVFDAFEFQDTFYIVCERCYWPLHQFIARDGFDGAIWLSAVARCVLQAVHFIHVSGYVHQDIHMGNVFFHWVKDELIPERADGAINGAMTFKVGDLGLTKLIPNVDAQNTVLADLITPPEAIAPSEFGPLDHRMDIYQCALLFLQVLHGGELRFARDEVLAGKPREMAQALPAPFNFALEKALRRHVEFRTATALEFWRDLNSSATNNVPDLLASQ